LLAACLLTLASLSGGETAHPNSNSLLIVTANEHELLLTWQIQVRTVYEVPEFEWQNSDLWTTTTEEVNQHWAQVRPYLEQNFQITVDGKAWQPSFDSYELREENAGFYVESRLALKQLPSSLVIGANHFFEDGNPEHYIQLEVHGLSPLVDRYFISLRNREVSFPLPRDPDDATQSAGSTSLQGYLEMGWHHVLAGFDHLAFVLALMFGVATWRALLGAITSFTVAHSLTLALSATGVFRLSPSIVEPGIALSVAVVLWWHLSRGAANSHAWKPAFGFGLLHGFGFAGVLGDIGLASDQVLPALLGFNLGVEVGQLTFVLPVLLVWLVASKMLPPHRLSVLRGYAALVLAAFAYHLVGNVLADHLDLTLKFLPMAFDGMIGAVMLATVLWLLLRKYRNPDGQAMGPMVCNALILALLYETGTWLGS
jgi:HupE/UreJ protein